MCDSSNVIYEIEPDHSKINYFYISLAGINIKIVCLYVSVHQYFSEFMLKADGPEIVVSTSYEEVIEFKNTFFPDFRLPAINIKEKRTGLSHDFSVFEYLVLQKKIADALLDYNIMLIHGAALGINDKSFIFTAPSGTGKTTHIRKWLDNVPGAFVVNGDKTFISIQKNNSFPPLSCGSPWAGKENLYTNTMIPLKAIICMERAEENHIKEISFAQAFPFLFHQIYCPDDKEKMKKTLRLLESISGKVKFYRFHCNNFKEDCFDVAYNALNL